MEANLKVTLLTHTPDAERIIATAAKLCYSELGITEIRDSLSKEEVDKFLNILMRMGHESPIEHVSFTFGIEGVSRSLTHQLVRHRIASYSQKSQRYVKEGQFEYIVPSKIANNPVTKELFLRQMESAQLAYDAIVEELFKEYLSEINGSDLGLVKTKKVISEYQKLAIEDARYVLPNACETKIVTTMNARQLLHFFNTRCCNRAQWEIRSLATNMLMQVRSVAPIIFNNAGPNCLNKDCPEGSMSCGKIKEVRNKFKID